MQLLRSLGTVRSSQQGQGHPGDADAEFLEGPAARNGLGHASGQFIESIVHNFSFRFSFQ